MARPLFDSPYLFGIHEPGGEEIYGAMPGVRAGLSLPKASATIRTITAAGIIAPTAIRSWASSTRLNNGYHPQGTIPTSDRYADFAQRCANFVADQPGL